jgi:predicted phage terminase large subunit-like protein
MPITTEYTLHTNGPALWPEHKSLDEVLELKATTPHDIFECTYQGNAVPPGGLIFDRAWWNEPERRYTQPEGQAFWKETVGRWISWDTAEKDKETNAYTVATVLDLLPDYRIAVRDVLRIRCQTPDLVTEARTLASRYNYDDKLRGMVIEDRSSGTTLYQTLAQAHESWIRERLFPFLSSDSKEMRAKQASVWCNLGCVLLPHPDGAVPWLHDWEEELFNFPGVTYKDQTDSFSQGVLYLEHLLSSGYRARMAFDQEEQAETIDILPTRRKSRVQQALGY